jgi:hypothetical protein
MHRFTAPTKTSFFSPTTYSRWILVAVAATVLTLPALAAAQQADSDDKDKHLDIQSSVGDLHVGSDADARKAGLPLYPGARLKKDPDHGDAVNFGLLTQAFGMKLVVAKYDSDDTPGSVIDYYRNKLKKYGKVIECHTREHGANVHSDGDDNKDGKSQHSKELKCEGDNSGPVTELKVGTEDDQHVVAVEPGDSGKGSTFAVVYLHTRGEHGDI